MHAIRAVEKTAYLASVISEATVTVLYVGGSEQSKPDVLSNQNSISIEGKRKERLHKTEEFLIKQGVSYSVTI
ncbi:hypothetical protein [Jeotgalibacillus soli]|uniref:Uncharacterized protein n=1 Tax=Jeotgalibacillus soli TaxID=889306 RepID=A0A0C2R901_9BACL|nr:hypothetical protein KP78_19030 [Jeotgalibacillus soli]